MADRLGYGPFRPLLVENYNLREIINNIGRSLCDMNYDREIRMKVWTILDQLIDLGNLVIARLDGNERFDSIKNYYQSEMDKIRQQIGAILNKLNPELERQRGLANIDQKLVGELERIIKNLQAIRDGQPQLKLYYAVYLFVI